MYQFVYRLKPAQAPADAFPSSHKRVNILLMHVGSSIGKALNEKRKM